MKFPFEKKNRHTHTDQQQLPVLDRFDLYDHEESTSICHLFITSSLTHACIRSKDKHTTMQAGAEVLSTIRAPIFFFPFFFSFSSF